MIRKNDLFLKELPATTLINNFVDGHPSNYEEYLLEIVNNSRFVDSYNGVKFKLRDHEEQFNKQSDAYNDFYEIEFKLLASTDYMQAKRELSTSITEIMPGCWAYGPSRNNGQKRVLISLMVLRGLSIGELKDIEIGKLNKTGNKFIKHILKKLKVDKNILFFVPYTITAKTKKINEKDMFIIIDWISEDLKGVLEYRKNMSDKETYFTFIFEDYFVITKSVDSKLFIYDLVKVDCIETFKELCEISDTYY